MVSAMASHGTRAWGQARMGAVQPTAIARAALDVHS